MQLHPHNPSSIPAPPRYFVIAGPTAIGKSAFAIRVAQRLETEIIGADAFQIYKGFDVLSAKPSKSQLEQIPHHLIDILEPDEMCDAHRYAQMATETIRRLNHVGKVPIVVGGTGFYIKALMNPLPDLPSPDPDLRTELESETLPKLLERLNKLDAITFERIDQQNRRRVIRALEVCLLTGKPFSSFQRITKTNDNIPAILLTLPREKLYHNINERVINMFNHGVVDEVANMGKVSQTLAQMIGIKPIERLLKGELTQDQCLAMIQQQTRHYAKRQLTWFRSQGFHEVPIENAPESVVEYFRCH